MQRGKIKVSGAQPRLSFKRLDRCLASDFWISWLSMSSRPADDYLTPVDRQMGQVAQKKIARPKSGDVRALSE